MNSGSLYAIGAYILWGLLPVYWKMLSHVSAGQLICHRIVWSFLTLVLLIVFSGKAKDMISSLGKPGVLKIFLPAAILISINWFLYIWAVNSGHIVETSLGYFINPLISVLLGVIFFGERLRPVQWISIAMAASGVTYLALVHGKLPWIALILAFSFAFYGAVKKKAHIGSLFGLTVETAILGLPALFYLLWCGFSGQGLFLHYSVKTDLLLAGAGMMTSLPLLLFASAAVRIPLSRVGLFQYMAPTLQLLIGVFVYGESFTMTRLAGFCMVWLALSVYIIEGFFHARQGHMARGSKIMGTDS